MVTEGQLEAVGDPELVSRLAELSRSDRSCQSALEVSAEIIAGVSGASWLRGEDCSFETERLSVAEWHAQSTGQPGSVLLAAIVRDMLTSGVTEQLPKSWQGSYSEKRALEWIIDRDDEGTQLLAVSSETREPVALLFLHETLHGSGAPELRVGYLVAESQWGRGIASELVRGLIAWARTRPVASIVAGVAAANGASIRVLEKSGLTRIEGERASTTELFYGIDL